MLDQAQNRKTFSNCQATYQKELCLLFKKSRNFFHRANVKKIGLNPLTLFISIRRFFRTPFPPLCQMPIIQKFVLLSKFSSGSGITIKHLLPLSHQCWHLSSICCHCPTSAGIYQAFVAIVPLVLAFIKHLSSITYLRTRFRVNLHSIVA